MCAFQVPATFGQVDVVDESFVEAAHRCDIAVHVWTINEADEMARLLDLGCDGLVERSTDTARDVASRAGLCVGWPARELAATAVRLFAVVGLLFARSLALHGPL